MPPAARWDKLSDRYLADVSAADPMGSPVAMAILQLLLAEPGEAVLDLACGPGHYSRHLARNGVLVTGVDVSTRLLEHARSSERSDPLGIDYLGSDAADPSLMGGWTFDGVLCSMALSDIDDLGGALANVRRLLRPGGRFVFSVLHPCFPGNERSRPSWPPTGYYDEGWWLAEGHHGYRGVVGASHRALSTYLNALTANDLTIAHVLEPADPDGILPMFLVVKAIRTA
jgi:SAM-dependent methyltransferase